MEILRATVDNAFTDNYWELLSIERMETVDDIILPGQSKNSDFERAEEKAVKASSSFIKPKQDLRWETHIKSIKIMWEIKYIKDSKLYILIKDHQKFYSSTTIEGIRNSFKAELLGTAAINTANNNLTNNQ